MTELYEDVAKLAQKYLEDIPAMIIGSGASIPYGIYSMNSFADELLKCIDTESDDWRKFRRVYSQHKNLELVLHRVDLSKNTLSNIIECTWNLFSQKDIEVFKSILNEYSEIQLTRLFGYFLRTANPDIFVITTNYDRLIEYAAGLSKAKIFTGFSDGLIQYPIPFKSKPKGAKIEILKVHGSLDWFSNKTGSIFSLPLATFIPKDCTPCIVTPGNTKYREVHKSPFRDILSRVDEVLESANSFLCIGFGFNDEHVLPKLNERVKRDGVPLVIITKQLSAAIHEHFLKNQNCKEFLFIEEHEQGSMIYTKDTPKGDIIKGSLLWKIDEFLNMVFEKED